MELALVAMAVGGGVQAYGAYEEGKNANDEARENARITRINASVEAYKARREAERFGGIKRRTLGAIKSMFASAGVAGSSGSAEDVSMDSAIQLELDQRNAVYRQTSVTQAGEAEAKNLIKAGKNAKRAGLLTAVGKGISTVGSVYSMGSAAGMWGGGGGGGFYESAQNLDGGSFYGPR